MATSAMLEPMFSCKTLPSKYRRAGRPRKLWLISLAEAQKRYRKGETTYNIARNAGVSAQTVINYLKESGVNIRTKAEIRHTSETRAKTGAAAKKRWKDPKFRAKMDAIHKDPEVRAKMSVAHKGRKPTSKARSNMSAAQKGRKITLKHRARISAAQKKRLKVPEARAKLSAAVTLAIQEGRLKPNGKGTKCKFISIKNQQTLSLDSLLEQSWCQVFESDPSIIAFKRAFLKKPPPSIVIPYRVRRSWHNYLPDFLVTYIDGHQELIECKPESRWHYPKNQAKWKAARRWCAAQSPPITFRVVGYDDLEEAVTIGDYSDADN